ncbi:MAG TPA: hypothetical protein VMT73_07375 [Anaerolineales bacterium]|nr:hypothetical protein [Anaerolineales bacterium]
MSDAFRVGERVKVFLDSKFWRNEGWFDGTVVRIDPYSQNRSFYWIETDTEIESVQGGKTKLVSVLNPKNIQKK